MFEVLHCQMTGLGTGSELGNLEFELVWNQWVMASELALNGGHQESELGYVDYDTAL